MSRLQECAKILGISVDAAAVDVRRAFKRKVLTCHPDKGGDVSQFNVVREAFEELYKHLVNSSCEAEQTCDLSRALLLSPPCTYSSILARFPEDTLTKLQAELHHVVPAEGLQMQASGSCLSELCHRAAQHARVRGKTGNIGMKGIKKNCIHYYAKIGFQHFNLSGSRTPSLAKAAEDYTRLLHIREVALRQLDRGQAFEDAVRAAVGASDVDRFWTELPLPTRACTPMTCDLELALLFRKRLFALHNERRFDEIKAERSVMSHMIEDRNRDQHLRQSSLTAALEQEMQRRGMQSGAACAGSGVEKFCEKPCIPRKRLLGKQPLQKQNAISRVSKRRLRGKQPPPEQYFSREPPQKRSRIEQAPDKVASLALVPLPLTSSASAVASTKFFMCGSSGQSSTDSPFAAGGRCVAESGVSPILKPFFRSNPKLRITRPLCILDTPGASHPAVEMGANQPEESAQTLDGPSMLFMTIPLKASKRISDNYDLSDYEYDVSGKRIQPNREGKRVPAWSSKYKELAKEQADVDPDSIFGSRVPRCDLDLIFPDSLYEEQLGCVPAIKKRDDSGHWLKDPLTRTEVSAYKRRTGQTRTWSHLRR